MLKSVQSLPLENLVCHSDQNILDALTGINGSPYLFQVVVDRDNCVVGTITDGDIRRALLGGVGTHEPVTRCMNRSPKLGQLGESTANEALLHRMDPQAALLPIVDEQRHLVEVICAYREFGLVRSAVVMAGGLGSRLGPVTKDLPKPLLPVAGRPILDRILTDLENAGIEKVYVTVNYLAEKVEDYLRNRDNRAEITVIREESRMGTAGSLSLITDRPQEPMLVMNGDVLTKVSFGALFAFHRKTGASATIAAANHETQIPYGVIQYDEFGGFRSVKEKPKLRHYVAAGIYVMEPEVLDCVPDTGATDMPELLNIAKSSGNSVSVFPMHEYWADVGQPKDLAEAQRHHSMTEESQEISK